MKFKTTLPALAAIAVILVLNSCKKTDIQSVPSVSSSSQALLKERIAENGNNPDEAIFKQSESNAEAINYVYMESNKGNKNSILVFSQQQNGQLLLDGEVQSGGDGYGDGLGSQGAIAISKEHNLLFAVNAGSNSISSFSINAGTGGLQLLSTIESKGKMPISLTAYGNRLYVLNAKSSTVSGFTFTPDGNLAVIKGSKYDLSSNKAEGAQIKFQPDGQALYVTEKATNIIDKFSLDNNGAITSAIHIQSKGVEPFGFDYGRNNRFLIVSNAANGASGAGSCTSYEYSKTSGLTDVNGAVSNFETAPCWVATTQHGVFAFVSNTGTNNISSYYIDENGMLTLIDAVAAADGKAPIDNAVSADNRYVYTIYSGSRKLVAYQRTTGGVIDFADAYTKLPAFAAGLAVY